MTSAPPDAEPDQADKFGPTAREPGCDEDEARREERWGKVARQKPVEGRPE
ncbi:MAG TPA: hypothetical protein VNT25_00940 [Allosphingosinicella sp.]|nr:hypothetical protein [Allosphingosinicella sp.]